MERANVTLPPLPDLQNASTMDARLRQVVTDRELLDRARSIAGTHVAEARRRGDDPALFRALGYLGEAERMAGRFAASETALLEAQAMAIDRGDARMRVAALIRLGELDRCRERYGTAETLLREALAIAADSGDPAVTDYRHFALQHLGKTLLNAGRYPEAIEALETALTLRRERGLPSLITSTEEALVTARSAPRVQESGS